MSEENFPQKHFLPDGASAKAGLPKGIAWGVVALILIFAVSLGVFLYDKSKETVVSVADNLNKLEQGVNDLKNLNPDSAKKNFIEAEGGFNVSGSIWQELGSVFGGAKDVVSGIGTITKQGAVLAEEIDFFENNLPELLFNNGGDEIISHLETVQGALREISAESDKLSSGATKLNVVTPTALDFYIPLKIDVARYESFLDSLIAWLKSDSPRHLLVMFQNPSEIRPAGGFLGSYADVALERANVKSVEVHDINDVTKDFGEKIIPPKPLQAEITSWKAADANWFFDFSKSAAQVLKFMEASRIYPVSSTTFDSAIAASPKVLGDILQIMGPLTVSSTRVALDKDNFLSELQKIVQQGQASSATYPKKALRELAAAISGKIQTFDASQKQELFNSMFRWIADKDLVFYFKDQELEKFLDYYNASGKTYGLTPDFEGDYLALVDANLGGGKSDIFIKQDIELQSQINTDGTVSDHLVISREHDGAKGVYWWYKSPNLDYLQLFLPPAAELVNFKGGLEKNVAAPINYAKNGYVADDYVAALESSTEKVFNYPAVSTHPESGKKVFAAWSRILVGQKTQIVFDYKSRLYLPPSDGLRYQFVFDKQAGISRNYKFTISAPVGFRFKENNLPVFEYEASDLGLAGGSAASATSTNPMPGRLILNLTLEKA